MSASSGDAAIDERALKRLAVYINSFVGVDRAHQTTGFRTNAQRFEANCSPGSATDIAQSFLVNSRLCRNDRETEESVRAYFSDSSMVMLSMLGQRRAAKEGAIKLPAALPLPLALGETLSRRRSIRSFTGDTMTIAYLGTILRASCGVTAETTVELETGQPVTLRFRTNASGGGLYPVDVLVAVLNVRELPRVIYCYNPLEHSLMPVSDIDGVGALLECFAVPEEVISVRRANVVLLFIGEPWRSMRKYGVRAMRFVFLEAGAMAQDVALATTALGYGSVDCASIYDDEVHEVLGLDGVASSLVHTMVVGCPA
jgi:SagB-type dehydrogenase family enzyme